MKTLVISPWSPWPPHSGGQIRLAAVVSALHELGSVDLFVYASGQGQTSRASRRPTTANRATSPFIRRACILPRPPLRHLSITNRGAWLMSGRLPLSVLTLDFSRYRQLLREWADPSYDLLWYVKPQSYARFGDLYPASVSIVDFDDLENHKILGRLHSMDAPQFTTPREWLQRIQLYREAQAWTRLQRSTARSVEIVTVCSQLDLQRLKAARIYNASVISNTYNAADGSFDANRRDRQPILLFQGSMVYPPNVAGARYLVEDIAPRIWKEVPDATIRIVGRVDDRVQHLKGDPRVTVVGYVPSMTSELSQARLCVVPLLYGGGTRIKILEAFASGLAVVTTPAGAEGLDVEEGRHLLIGRGPAEFAEACIRLLKNPGEAERLAMAAARLFEERYSWESVKNDIINVATEARATSF